MRITHWLIALSHRRALGDGLLHRPSVHDRAGPGRPVVRHGLDEGHPRLRRVSCSSRAVIARIIWMFTGNKYARWDKFIPVHARAPARHAGRRSVLLCSRCDKPPGFVGHNPVAGPTYTLVFGLYFVAIATGLVMRGAERRRRLAAAMVRVAGAARRRPAGGALDSPRRDVAAARLRACITSTARVLMSTIEANATIESIFSGYKFVPRRGSRVLRLPLHQPQGQVDE